MKKPLVFISHIHEEAEVAIALRTLIEDSFLGLVGVFVSSDKESNGVGEKWLDKITDSLKTCDMEIVLCSEEAVKRPWINFEAGSGWVRDIIVAPLCYAGMTPSKLPIPLNLLNAIDLKSIPQLKNLFSSIADVASSKEPQVSYDEFLEKVIKFEEQYLFWDTFNEKFSQFIDLVVPKVEATVINENGDLRHSPIQLTNKKAQVFISLFEKEPFRGFFSEVELFELKEVFKYVKNYGLLEIKKENSYLIFGCGYGYWYSFKSTPKLIKLLKNSRFKATS